MRIQRGGVCNEIVVANYFGERHKFSGQRAAVLDALIAAWPEGLVPLKEDGYWQGHLREFQRAEIWLSITPEPDGLNRYVLKIPPKILERWRA